MQSNSNKWYQLDKAEPTIMSAKCRMQPSSRTMTKTSSNFNHYQTGRHTSKSTKKISLMQTLDTKNISASDAYLTKTLDNEDRDRASSLRSHDKRMLPSSFTRTSTQKQYLRNKIHQRSGGTVGPAEYELEPIIRNTNSASQFKAGPQYTIPVSSTHRGPIEKR